MQTQGKIAVSHSEKIIGKNDPTLLLGSCFADVIARKMRHRDYDTLCNPFGTLFNPASICSSLKRLESEEHFTMEDCVRLGADDNRWCSFHHYTKFARDTPDEFLSKANRSLDEAITFYRDCKNVIITFGTSYCFRHIERDMIVANCLKVDSRQFERFLLGVDEIVNMFEPIVSDSGKRFIFTVSPIRHLADGAHGNTISKSILLLGSDGIISRHSSNCFYFPAYEIMMDELRDFKWYADDKVHPSEAAETAIWERFKGAWL